MSEYRSPSLHNFEWQQPVEDRTTNPAGSESKGDRYLITTGSGDFLNKDNNIATAKQANPSDPSHWYFDGPLEGMITYVKDEDENYLYVTSWTAYKDLSDKESTVIRNSDNVLINAFRIAVNGSLTQFNIVDGIVDEYEDESSIDTVNSTYEEYDAVNDLYKPTVGLDTKLLLHCNGTDASTDFVDNSSSEHTVTAHDNAQLDTATKKWGTASGLLDGTGDYLSIPDSTDWDVMGGTIFDEGTIDFWVKHTDHSSGEYYVGQYADVNNHWGIYHQDGVGIVFVFKSGGSVYRYLYGGEITDTDWHHIALCRVYVNLGGVDYYRHGLYKDGQQVAYGGVENILNSFASILYIGKDPSQDTYYFDGHMDEIRIAYINKFNANPNSSKTDTIDVPTGEHSLQKNNMTLISDSFTAEAQPDSARIVLLEEDVDSVTLNTDLKAYMSIDDGSNWHQGTLSDEGDYDTSKRILVANFDVSAEADTDVKYKIETANEKDLKLHATGISWK